MALLKEKGSEHISLAVGGVIPPRDFARLKEMGVKGAFQPHTLTSTVIDFVKSQTAEVIK
jgi:methylmalonyl-CoA mutase cobalamin-binding domain/chain